MAPEGFVRPTDAEIVTVIEEQVHTSDTEWTVRQLWYYLVSHKYVVPNVMANYKWVVARLKALRKNGSIPWDTFIDRDRASVGLSAMEPKDPIDEAEMVAGWITNSRMTRLHRWTRQPILVRIAIEKKGLTGVFEKVCESLGMRLSPFKGDPSVTFLWDMAKGLLADMEVVGASKGVILYYGDHDPKGMTIPTSAIKTILDEMNWPDSISLVRCGLNLEQAEELELPPDFATVKPGDSTLRKYLERYGDTAWELDAVPHATLQAWVRRDTRPYFDDSIYAGVVAEDEERNAVYKERIVEAAREVLEEYDAELDEDDDEEDGY